MAEKRTLEKISESPYVNIKDEKVKEAFLEYAWQCPVGFIRFARIARLAEVDAPGIILLHEMRRMCDYMAKYNIARNEIARMKNILFEANPKLEKSIAKARQEERAGGSEESTATELMQSMFEAEGSK